MLRELPGWSFRSVSEVFTEASEAASESGDAPSWALAESMSGMSASGEEGWLLLLDEADPLVSRAMFK